MIISNYRQTIIRILNEDNYPDNWNARFVRLLELNGLHLMPMHDNPYHGTPANPFILAPLPSPRHAQAFPPDQYIVPIGWTP